MKKAFGNTGKIILDVMIGFSQFSFGITQMLYIVQSLRDITISLAHRGITSPEESIDINLNIYDNTGVDIT